MAARARAVLLWTFGGYTIPSRMAGGWWYGTVQYLEVIRLRVNWAQLE
jgi:hypothetical protein